MRYVATAVVTLAACLHVAVWALVGGQATAPEFDGTLASVSYSPFSQVGHPDRGERPTTAQIRSDLRVLASHARAIRTYSATGGVELVPAVAEELGLKVTAGAWIDKDEKRNEREIRSVVDLAKRHHNIDALVVGNETIFRGEQKVADLIKIIQRVKRETRVPVTTGEIWHVWLEHPELASSVDFIAAHVLPYWEGFSENAAVDQAVIIYNKLRQAFPGKRIVIAEFGWPSAGYNLKAANPGRFEQAQVLRSFVSRAEQLGIDYNIVEAVDQPWKIFEGGVGPYWGIFDAEMHPKFAWTGPITDPDHWKLMGIAVLLGVLFSLPILALGGATLGQATMLGVSAHAVGAWLAAVFAFWKGHYFVPGAAFALGLGLVLLIPLILVALARIEEIAMIAFGRKPQRLVSSPPLVPGQGAPKVSIHVPAYFEPPDMLKATLDSVARLDYPNFECVVVINNTPDPTFWQPIEEHCRALGERFKFINAEKLAGFKAGALRLALERTAPDASVIGVIDADYVVDPDWLKDLVPLFEDPQVGLVQAPQDHRDAARSPLHHAMNAEYAGFFDIGMVQRNEANAIIVHGTMCLIRRSALEEAGNWSSDTICEDTDTGLAILELGYVAHYTNRRYGHGLLPNSFEAYKKQRDRWAYGGFQILKKHWRRFLPGESRLTREQKREFMLGWLSWLGAESIGVLVAIFNLLWVPVVAFADIAIPDRILTLPIIAAFVVSVGHFAALYRLRVRIPGSHMVGAVFAAMSVQWTVARAVALGLVKDHLPFVRTAKGGAAGKKREFQAFWEAVMAAGLWIGAATLVATNQKEIREIYLFAGVLVIQSLPFLAAAGLALFETSRLNDYGYWRAVERRFAELMPRRAMVKASTPSENQAEPVQ